MSGNYLLDPFVREYEYNRAYKNAYHFSIQLIQALCKIQRIRLEEMTQIYNRRVQIVRPKEDPTRHNDQQRINMPENHRDLLQIFFQKESFKYDECPMKKSPNNEVVTCSMP